MNKKFALGFGAGFATALVLLLILIFEPFTASGGTVNNTNDDITTYSCSASENVTTCIDENGQLQMRRTP